MTWIHDLQPGLSLAAYESILTLLALVFSFVAPAIGRKTFRPMEIACKRLASNHALAVASIGLTALLMRLALLFVCPIPKPFTPDDFSFLLGAQTFAQGHLTNLTPVMWQHFESIHITMSPSYTSMYFPGQALILAAGQVFLGNPWFGLLCITSLMCAAICWMLQAWLPAPWALLGGGLAILRIGLFSYWMNTFTGAGSLAALGGALVLGAFPRVMKKQRWRDFFLLGLGVVLLFLTRPFEGFLLCLPVAIVLAHWLLFGKNRPRPALLLRHALLPAGLMLGAAAWLGYYDQQAFGSPLTLPYTVDRATYAVAPYWIWEKARPEPHYRHQALHDFYVDGEYKLVQWYRTPTGFVLETLYKPYTMLQFFAGIALLPGLLMLHRVVRDRRLRFFVVAAIPWMIGMGMGFFLIPHYLAPFTCAFYLIGLQSLRHLRVWRPRARPVGAALVRSMVVVCVVLAALRAAAGPLKIKFAEWPGAAWDVTWYGPGDFGAERAQLERKLEELPGKQLVLVRYSAGHDPINEWVYNAPDIDHSRVIWAREMSAADNIALTNYYKDRSVWLVQPDRPATITPYDSAVTATISSGPQPRDNHRAISK